MTFISILDRPKLEPKDILLIGLNRDADAIKMNKILPSAQESVLEQALHMAGLTKGSVNFINLFPDSTTVTPFWQDNAKPAKRYFKPAAEHWLARCNQQINDLNPKVIVPLGEIPVYAMLNRHDYTSIRGYPFQKNDRLIVPSLHPRDMIWSNYIWRFYLANDLKRAKEFASGATIIEPDLRVVQTAQEAIALLEHIVTLQRSVAFDIEVSNYEVSCIGFSNQKDWAFTIPLDDRWSIEDEVYIWQAIAKVMECSTLVKITQNGIFDTYFIFYKNGILCRGVVEDTMIGHSIAYPDMLKGLGFLGSIHTRYTYWKDQSPHKHIKKED